MRKICTVMMCMIMCGAALYAQTEADFDMKTAGNGVVITKYKGAGSAGVIPTTIGGKAVVGIGEGAFSYCNSLKPELRADIERRFGGIVFAARGG